MDQAQELEQEVAVEALSSMLIVEHAVGIGLGIVDAPVVQGIEIVEDILRAVRTDSGQADHTPSVVGDVHIPSAMEVAAVDMD